MGSVGIHAIEVYTPRHSVRASDLEKDHGVEGKYTRGLCMVENCACDEDEDAVSMALTVFRRLVENRNIGYDNIGMVQVGSESLLDRSKSIKSHIMSLFGSNTDVEGTDCYHACYGGTAALIACVNWAESTSYDGRWAVVVCTDICDAPEQYEFMNGAASVAMLIGPNAPLSMEGKRVSHMIDEWDFYKPIGWPSMGPLMDGQRSKDVYFDSLATCQQRFQVANGVSFVQDHEALVFHLGGGYKFVKHAFAHAMKSEGMKCTDDNVQCEFQRLVEPSLRAAVRIGPMHTAAVYVNLYSLLESSSLNMGSRIGVFSFGSGAACTMYTMRLKSHPALGGRLFDVLESRTPMPVNQFSKVCFRYSRSYGRFGYQPKPRSNPLARSYFIKEVTARGKRVYEYAKFEQIDVGDDDEMDSIMCKRVTIGDVSDAVHSFVPSLNLDVPIMNSGLDSLGAAELRSLLGSLTEREIPETLIFDHPTIRNLQQVLTDEESRARETMFVHGVNADDPKNRNQNSDKRFVKCAVHSLIPGLDMDAPIMKSGIDSLGAAELRSQLGDFVVMELPETLIFDYPTIRELENKLDVVDVGNRG